MIIVKSILFVSVCAESVPDISSEGTALADNLLLVSLTDGTVVLTVTDLPGGDDFVLVLWPTVPVSGVMLHSPVHTPGLVTELDVEGVAHGHLQLGEVELRVVKTAVSCVEISLVHPQLPLLSSSKFAGVILYELALNLST